MRAYKTKKFSTVGGNYVNVRVYKSLKALRNAYKQECKKGGLNEFVDDILGVHCAYKKYIIEPGGKLKDLTNETGTVYLTKTRTEVKIVAHEFIHALLHSHKHSLDKEQYPLCIDNMEQEEDIAYGLTDMIEKFYKWLPKIKF